MTTPTRIELYLTPGQLLVLREALHIAAPIFDDCAASPIEYNHDPKEAARDAALLREVITNVEELMAKVLG